MKDITFIDIMLVVAIGGIVGFQTMVWSFGIVLLLSATGAAVLVIYIVGRVLLGSIPRRADRVSMSPKQN